MNFINRLLSTNKWFFPTLLAFSSFRFLVALPSSAVEPRHESSRLIPSKSATRTHNAFLSMPLGPIQPICSMNARGTVTMIATVMVRWYASREMPMVMYHPVVAVYLNHQLQTIAFIPALSRKCNFADRILRTSLLTAKGIVTRIQIGESHMYCVFETFCTANTTVELTCLYSIDWFYNSEGDLVCFERDPFTDVPGCTGGRVDGSRTDFCVKPSDLEVGPPPKIQVVPNPIEPLSRCEGDCDSDDDCEGDLVCFQRSDCMYAPGCDGGIDDYSRTDYCVRKSDVSGGKLSLEILTNSPLQLCQGKVWRRVEVDGFRPSGIRSDQYVPFHFFIPQNRRLRLQQ